MAGNKQKRDIRYELKAHGAVLVRTNKHEIWRLPNGQQLTLSHSAGDPNTYWAERRQLRRALAFGVSY